MSSSPCKRHWQLSALQLHCQLYILFVSSLTFSVFLECCGCNLPSCLPPLEVYSFPLKPWPSSTGWKNSEVSREARHIGADGPEQRGDRTYRGGHCPSWAPGQGSTTGETPNVPERTAPVSHQPIVALIRHSTVNKWTDFSGQASTGAVWSFGPSLLSWMCRIWPVSI